MKARLADMEKEAAKLKEMQVGGCWVGGCRLGQLICKLWCREGLVARRP